ncbi:aldehyde dehydrogenase [Vibrio natriegens]|uniref:aldehyde dehydrogenase family protein n=1 Tax=Vibrio natriegens TaxID=691 RepID=UPI0008040787|nr:aldehyde dehydrogenase family protein [Vibrio natriegens]ANQ24693.1 aldehyde dehydrogenase [Vibrio natriegens]
MDEIKKPLIGGNWLDTDEVIENINPADPDDIVGTYGQVSVVQVALAIEEAKAAQPAWASASPQFRSDILQRTGNLILARCEAIATILSREEGKTLTEAKGEVMRAGHLFQFFAGEAVRLAGYKVDSVRQGCEVDVTREPLGVVGLITPWNFPIAIPAWKAAPALAAGNCVVLKPAEITPACAHILASILHEAGCPEGVFNLVIGSGSLIGNAIVEHPDVVAISFTGSEVVGRRIAASCAKHMKKVQLEMGGKNPMVVLADADLDIAVNACLNGSFYSTGQRCTASSRLIVDRRIHNEFVERLDKARQSMIIGNPLNPETQMGPVVSRSQLANNLEYVALAKKEGCEVLGGERLDTPGYFQAPALFLGASNSMRSSQEEIFGPCASVLSVDGFDEAVSVANDTRFGLSAGICTSSLKYATAFRQQAKSGMVMINLPTAGVDYHVPFGGRKSSSLGGREQGSMAMDFYTTVKTAYIFAG